MIPRRRIRTVSFTMVLLTGTAADSRFTLSASSWRSTMRTLPPPSSKRAGHCHRVHNEAYIVAEYIPTSSGDPQIPQSTSLSSFFTINAGTFCTAPTITSPISTYPYSITGPQPTLKGTTTEQGPCTAVVLWAYDASWCRDDLGIWASPSRQYI